MNNAWQTQLRDRLIGSVSAYDLDAEQQARFELLVEEALDQSDEALYDDDPALLAEAVEEHLRNAIAADPELMDALSGEMQLFDDDDGEWEDAEAPGSEPFWDTGMASTLDPDEEY